MSSWSEILRELTVAEEEGRPAAFDYVRRKYVSLLHRHSGRNVILYAAGWLQKKNERSLGLVSIGDEDMLALMEVCQELEGDRLDLILHSPGGSPEAAEAVVSYLRSQFSHIRVIVPLFALSAATMIACAADEIVLGTHSFLGPTDSQIILPAPYGRRMVSAQAVLDQFDRARKECADPQKLSVWLPMLSQYGPDILEECRSQLVMSEELVKTWLETYMFKNDSDRASKAGEVSGWLAGRENFQSHNRRIPREEAKRHGLKVSRLEDDKELHHLVLSVFHATIHMFSGTSAIKIVENQGGRAFIVSPPVSTTPTPAQQS